MVKRILVALDPDRDTAVAVRYAIELARTHGGRITGLALLADEALDRAVGGAGIGAMHYAEKRREELAEVTLQKAESLLDAAAAACGEAAVPFQRAAILPGISHEQVVGWMKTHDLLVTGHASHFFYADPQRRTHTVERIVQAGAAATLVVVDDLRPIRRIVVAYDGSLAAARTLQKFANLEPFGHQLEVNVLDIITDDDAAHRAQGERDLAEAAAYLEAHGFEAPTPKMLVGDDPKTLILDHAAASGADLIIAGAYARTGVERFFFGSITAKLIEETPIPLFLYH